jgi:hypothetical protein
VVERKLRQPVADERRREVVVEQVVVRAVEPKRALESSEVEERAVALSALDDAPRGAELRDVGGGVG